MERKQALKLLIDLKNAQGVHTGKWDDEYNREESTEEYFQAMIGISEALDIPVTINLEDYREYAEDQTYELKDRAGFELHELCQSKLVQCLLNGSDECV